MAMLQPSFRAVNIIFYVLYRRIKFRRDEHIIEKLQWIYKILCGLTNMRNRDLKTLVRFALFVCDI